MNLLQDILSQQNGGVVKQLASQYGLDESQAQSAISSLVPALARGVRNNAAQGGNGIESLMGALQSAGDLNSLSDAAQLGGQPSVDQGNNFLGQIFGSKDVSRGVADRASEQTGIGSDILRKMLPVLATAVMGSLNRNASSGFGGAPSGGGALGGLGGMLGSLLGGGSSNQQSGTMGMLTQFLDADGDGSILDDVVGMLGRR